MKSNSRSFLVLFGLLLLLSKAHVPAHAGSANLAAADTPEMAIKAVLLQQVDAWNHGKLEAFMEGYWRSPELTFFSGGNIAQGWDAALDRYRKRYQAEGKEMGHLEFQDLKVQQLGPKAAVVTGKWQLTMSDGKQPHGLFTLICKQMPEGWRIVHDHTSSAE